MEGGRKEGRKKGKKEERRKERKEGGKEGREEGDEAGRKKESKGVCMVALVFVTVKRSTRLLACWACYYL